MQLLRMFHTFRRPDHWQNRPICTLKLLFVLSVLALFLPLSACSQDNSDSRSARRAIAQSQAIAADVLQTELALSPETASRLGLERELGPATSFALDNHSQAGFERRRLVRIELLQRLRHDAPEQHVRRSRELLIRAIAVRKNELPLSQPTLTPKPAATDEEQDLNDKDSALAARWWETL